MTASAFFLPPELHSLVKDFSCFVVVEPLALFASDVETERLIELPNSLGDNGLNGLSLRDNEDRAV